MTNIINLKKKEEKTLFNQMQESFSTVLTEHNSILDTKSIEKEMKKSYMKLLSNNKE